MKPLHCVSVYVSVVVVFFVLFTYQVQKQDFDGFYLDEFVSLLVLDIHLNVVLLILNSLRRIGMLIFPSDALFYFIHT